VLPFLFQIVVRFLSRCQPQVAAAQRKGMEAQSRFSPCLLRWSPGSSAQGAFTSSMYHLSSPLHKWSLEPVLITIIKLRSIEPSIFVWSVLLMGAVYIIAGSCRSFCMILAREFSLLWRPFATFGGTSRGRISSDQQHTCPKINSFRRLNEAMNNFSFLQSTCLFLVIMPFS
jgi:hypothetical protein